MAKQTTAAANANIYYADGCKVEVKASASTEYTDLGIIMSSVTNQLNWDETTVETANYDKLDKRIRNMTISGAFTLGNLNPDGLAEISGGLLTSTTVDTTTTVTGGVTSATLAAYAMKITHTDDNAKTRVLELFSVDTNSGGFAFNFKGANESGLEEMPLSYTAKIDTTLTAGAQLFSWAVEDEAE